MSAIGVLLAAGTGSRFEDGNKLRRTVAGEPIVRRAARRLRASPVDETVVVLGHDAERVRAALEPVTDHVTIVRNERYHVGQSTSARRGARVALDRECERALFALGDMPWVESPTYARLLDAATDTDAPITVPVTDGRRGNPVVFDARALRSFDALSGDVGGRSLFDSSTVARVAVDDPGIHADVDTVADLDR
ncbi:nucleotidyltransferase family protein [Halarchaeum nitratireducens]|uniref:MobA-like NTP transferase domain-containing protein n=1 Tax=Halarchaeum nitratireducens TaxID=489913 RepID=A0A830GDB8_9EURY|nr:nucleotidyltransferase family protein [Halarchaeum nitratireducens]MBP2252488.1 molybdenum cofactor cytidylyltransferase [Halarchaeum solikamskense]GGN20865.1 hypothetical protein GCM10009021_22600 [Halarchaeum nitratireducens]